MGRTVSGPTLGLSRRRPGARDIGKGVVGYVLAPSRLEDSYDAGHGGRRRDDEVCPEPASHLGLVAVEQPGPVFRSLASPYRLPLLWLDWSGARVASVESVQVGDYDEPGRRIRLRASTTKTRRPLWVELPEVLAEAISASLPPREDRQTDAPLFPDATADRLRTAIGRACKASGIPVFSPHDLRHCRISLLHHRGRSWAEIGALVGQRKLSITADTYTHVLSDGRELDLRKLLGRDRAVLSSVLSSNEEIAA